MNYFDTQYRRSLEDIPRQFDQIDTTLFATILDFSADRRDNVTCHRCKSTHLLRDCPFRTKTKMEEGKTTKKSETPGMEWKYEKWFYNNIEGCNLYQRKACQQGKDCKRSHVCKTCRGDHPLADCKIVANKH